MISCQQVRALPKLDPALLWSTQLPISVSSWRHNVLVLLVSLVRGDTILAIRHANSQQNKLLGSSWGVLTTTTTVAEALCKWHAGIMLLCLAP
jgi:hypothetical protein